MEILSKGKSANPAKTHGCGAGNNYHIWYVPWDLFWRWICVPLTFDLVPSHCFIVDRGCRCDNGLARHKNTCLEYSDLEKENPYLSPGCPVLTKTCLRPIIWSTSQASIRFKIAIAQFPLLMRCKKNCTGNKCKQNIGRSLETVISMRYWWQSYAKKTSLRNWHNLGQDLSLKAPRHKTCLDVKMCAGQKGNFA